MNIILYHESDRGNKRHRMKMEAILSDDKYSSGKYSSSFHGDLGLTETTSTEQKKEMFSSTPAAECFV